jgi:hypothetical protein
VMGCDFLKTVYKNKDMIFSDEIIVNTITVWEVR